MSRIRDLASMLTASTDMATDAEVTSSIASHAAAADPHSVYLKESEFNAAGKNLVINGAFDIWQRATSTAHGAGIFVTDRWRGDQGAGGGDYTTSRQNVSTGEPFNYCARITRTTTTTTPSYFYTAIESVNSIIAKGNVVTLSFYARKGSGFSGVLVAHLYSGTGTDQGTPHGFTNLVDNSSNINLTTSFQRFTITTSSALSTSTNQLGVTFNTVNQTGTPTNDYVEITGIQLELGSTATPFSRAGGNYATELELCRRYYFEGYISVISGGTNGIHGFLFMNPMRTTPSVTFEYDSINNRVYRMDNAARYDLVSPTIIATPNALTTMYAFTPAGWAGSAGIGFNAYWRFNAEL